MEDLEAEFPAVATAESQRPRRMEHLTAREYSDGKAGSGTMKQDRKKVQVAMRRILPAAAIVSGFAILAVLFCIFAGRRGQQESYTYKETQVEYGMLTIGITESGSIDIGTVEQDFDLDMNALQRVDTGSSQGGSSGGTNMSGMGAMPGLEGMGTSGGGLDMFSQMFGGGGNLIETGQASSLTVAGVRVSVGQQVTEGEVLYELAEESVSELEQKLQSNVEKAKADLDAVYADQNLSKQTAKYTYESSIAYGEYATAEYNATLQELSDTVESSRITLERATTSLTEYQSRLADLTESYDDAVQVLENCQYSLNHTPFEDVGHYAYYYGLVESAQQTVDSLKQQKEQLENTIEQAQSNVETARKNYSAAKRKLEQGRLSAKQTYDLRNLAYSTAQETYDITLAYLEGDVATQEAIYQETKEKWEEFSSYISGNAVLARYNGVVTSVELTEGDSIRTGSALITLYDMDDVGMSVTVYEEDMADISLGSSAKIHFTAYPEDIFAATVTEISEASTDSRGNIVYEVTVTVEGDVSGLFQGMTGDVTFVTGQSEETLYVYRRAVITEDGKSYVKIRQEDGSIIKKEIITGFTDGTYIQVVEGLAQGDVVLIESKVSGS